MSEDNTLVCFYTRGLDVCQIECVFEVFGLCTVTSMGQSKLIVTYTNTRDAMTAHNSINEFKSFKKTLYTLPAIEYRNMELRAVMDKPV